MRLEVPEVRPAELKRELEMAEPPILLDVREAEELKISCFENFVHIPLMELPERAVELSADSDLVIVCRSGSRSAQATLFLLRVGFKRVRNLVGGINAWAVEVDPSFTRY